ncbi:TrkA-N domain-containing protein [Halogranum rubrum]|uniref:TrkA-N domain-containing protein n=1 Tax=Halogranum rubrum TaxID=553466 RepID=A0A1I4E4X3_9EURY|nr:NAD-binding protein [Halogranum rubrum]SFL00805.1 TrkA-N domain-containing protein [Halogranum rubrum]
MGHDIVIVGGGVVGETLAEALERASVEVVYLDTDSRAVDRAAESGVDAQLVETSEATALDHVSAEDVGIAIVASSEDSRNLLVAQLLQVRSARRVVALVNDPDNVELFVDAGVEPVCATSALVSALDDRRRTTRDAAPQRTRVASEVDTSDDASDSGVDA